MSTAIATRPNASLTSIIPALKLILARLTPSASGSLLPFIPRSIKILLLLLTLLNAPSFPLQWHIRVWYHAIKAYVLLWRKGRDKYLDDWEAQNYSRGGVRGIVSVLKRIALPDDCDYNMHLSNSCYSKNSDPARMQHCIESLSPLFTPGVAMALAGSHYIFIKEIPIGSTYQMETRVVGWGEKWYYLVTEFIIHPKPKSKGKGKGKGKAMGKEAESAVSAMTSSRPDLALPAPVPGADATGTGESTPDRSSGATSPSPAPIQNLDEAKRAALRQRPVRPDGGVVACIAVWEYCFKMGRVTVPPRIALYVGFQSPRETDRRAARKLILSKDHGRAWLRGGWKNEPNADDIGRDIGLVFESENEGGDGEDVRVIKAREEGKDKGREEGDDNWIQRGRRAMEGMTLGIASLYE